MKRFFIKFFRGIKYFKMGLHSEDFDYTFLLELERSKLKRMYDYFSKANIIEREWEIAKDIKLAIKMLDIVLEDDTSYHIKYDAKRQSYNQEIIKYVNTRNAHRFLDPDQINILNGNSKWTAIAMRDELRISKAWHIYCELRKNFLRTWCD